MNQDFFPAVLNNRVLISALLGWISAQGIKIISAVIRQKKLDARWIIGTGGMPSSHAAGVSALATAVGLTHGFDSGLFALSFIFAVVTMFDAQGVRRAAGKQASIINKLLSERPVDFFKQEKKLIELLGHTPIEVFAGAIVGILVTIIYM
jgi:acid phosphatase family membrane protein YuiD